MSGLLFSNMILFGRVLRNKGLDAGPGRLVDLARALEEIPLRRKTDFYYAARSLFVHRREEIPVFDDAFQVFWRRPARGQTTQDLAAMGERRRLRRGQFISPSGAPPGAGAASPSPETSDPPRLRVTLTYSPREVLRHKDFGTLTVDELAQIETFIERLTWRIGERWTRRRGPGSGPRVDLRRTVRENLRHGGEVLVWARRERKKKPRPLVVLADISGSMERYTRLLLLFLYGLAEGLERGVEAFAFGTRLTRVTRELRDRDARRALSKVSRAVPDWSGGTRIGESLKAFNFGWARRVLSRGAIVIVISDGWDRGEPQLLSHEMARLQRSCNRLIWLNPLLGSPDYEPLTRGMQAALPFIDDFLPVHNFASLEDLARHLKELPSQRAARRQQALVG